jgi:uncharacterized membrane protein
MNAMKSFLWRTFVHGAFVVLPICVIVIVLTRTIAATLAYVESIAAALPFAAVFPGHWVIAWAMVLLALACFTVGLVLGLPPARRLVAAAEDSLVRRYPIYGRLRGFEKGILGMGPKQRVQAALAEMGDSMVLVFVTEELPDGRCVVFVPQTADPRDGPVYILVRERVHLIDASARQVVNCVLRWGVGAGDLIKSMRQAA